MTHDPQGASWLESANQADSPFPIQNLPLCRFSPDRSDSVQEIHIGLALGDSIIDLTVAQSLGLVELPSLAGGKLETLANHSNSVRQQAFVGLSRETGSWQSQASLIVRGQAEATLLLPFEVGNYTDFYASIDHARNRARLHVSPRQSPVAQL